MQITHSPCSLYPLTRLLPLGSPFGPTFGCSISHLPRCSIVVKSAAFGMKPFSFVLPMRFLAIVGFRLRRGGRVRCGGRWGF